LTIFADYLACDAHCHIVGPEHLFPLVPGASGNYPKEELFELHARLGVKRSVIVQSARHGTDNSAVQDALLAGQGRYVGVAVVDVGVSDEELGRLASSGFRGVRFNFMRHIVAKSPIEAIVEMTPRLARAGLHLQVHFEPDLIHSLAPHLKRSEVPVVIDHMGRVDASKGPEHENFLALTKLLQDEKFFVKLSGLDRVDRDPPYAAGVELARTLMTACPDRCFWGTDWPHLNHDHRPEDEVLARATFTIAPTPELHHQLLVDNPAQFYKFRPLQASSATSTGQPPQ
jgi:2-pyrone-4,6-dicarboxylate lactonase